MHIQRAKEQIKYAVLAYSAKDSHGRPRIPLEKQRPVFLLGAPGIGKTAIVEQIARELDIGFVSYAMTHHTRQSALGLPYIVQKDYGGTMYSVSEYTMSEILASVYEEMEKTGKTEGILFLDEINCVSETLAPGMLQFLQYKTFGRHHVPQGWIVITAGNPPEYNDAVRDYDIAMLDRLKKITVEPDLDVWRTYAVQNGVHPAILSYLQIRPRHFYRVISTLEGKSFVTARSWDDLSQMIVLYEEQGLPVDSDLICQYLQDDEIAREFAGYYSLFRKYRSDYAIPEILTGTASAEVIQRAHDAPFDERLSLVNLLIASLDEQITGVKVREDAVTKIVPRLRSVTGSCREALGGMAAEFAEEAEQTAAAETIAAAEAALAMCRHMEELLREEDSYDVLKPYLQDQIVTLQADVRTTQAQIEHVFTFFENSFQDGQEILILVSEMTIRPAVSAFLYAHGSEKYAKYNKKLLFDDTRAALQERIRQLPLNETE